MIMYLLQLEYLDMHFHRPNEQMGFSNASYAWVHAFTAFNNSSYFRHNFSNDTASLEYHFPPPGAHQSGIKFDIGWGPGQSNYSKIATSQAANGLS